MRIYFNENPGNILFSSNEMGILNIDLNNINVDNNFDEDDPDTIILIRLLAWYIKFDKRKALKKELHEKLMLIAWHPKRWWNSCVSKDEKKEIEPIFTEGRNILRQKIMNEFSCLSFWSKCFKILKTI